MRRKLIFFTFGLIAINFLLWNWVMPVFEPADESGHYAHILYILRQKRLPNLVEPVPIEKGVGYTTYSPLYYWSLIPLARLVEAPLESEELLPYHPQKELFKKSVFGVYLHTKDELLFKWNRLILAVNLLRLQTSIYGLLTVYLVYLTGKKVFGEVSRKPLLAAALVGLNPMFAHISNSIVNVNLGILLFSLFFYLAVRSFARLPAGQANFSSVKFAKLNFGLGVIVGLAYLTKITGLVLIPIWFLSTIIITKTLLKSFADRALFLVKSLGLFLLGFLTAAGWYLARNYILYGSLLETNVAIKHFGRPAMQLEISGPINYWIGFIQTNFKTFFSGYGVVTVQLPETIIYLLALAAAIGFWGILIRWTANLDCHAPPLAGLAITRKELFLTMSAILIILGHVVVNFSVEAFHARDLFVGMVPFSLLLVDGLASWLKQLRLGKLWFNRIINFLMFSIFLVVTLFHFTQPVLADFIKLILSGFQILSPVTTKLAGFIAIFYLLWIIFRVFSSKIANLLDEVSANKNFLWWLSGSLFLSNLIILSFLVVPRLYLF